MTNFLLVTSIRLKCTPKRRNKSTRWYTLNMTLTRPQWVGHLMRMKDERVRKKALERYTKMETSWKAHKKMETRRRQRW